MNMSKYKIEYLNNHLKWKDLIAHYSQTNKLTELLVDTHFFNQVMKIGCLSTYNVSSLFQAIQSKEDLVLLNKNIDLLYYMLKNSLISFERFVVAFKSLDALDVLLSNRKLFSKLNALKNENSLSASKSYFDTEKLGFLLGKIDAKHEVEVLIYNEELLQLFVEDGKFNKLVSLFKNLDYLDLLLESTEFFESAALQLTTKNYEFLIKNIDGKNLFELKSLVNLNISLLKKCIFEGCDFGLKLQASLIDFLSKNLKDAQYTDEEKEDFQNALDLLNIYRFLHSIGLTSSERRIVLNDDKRQKICFNLMTDKETINKRFLMKALSISETARTQESTIR